MAKSFHIGLDYGTSASKLVVRHYDAPGGDLAELVPNGKGIRHPATIALSSGKLYFGDAAERACGARGAIRYDSMKMRTAAEASRDPSLCFAPCPELPDGMTAAAAATVSVWTLLTEAHRHIVERLGVKRWFRTPQYKALVTLGLPTSFFVNAVLRRRFWEILEAALYLFKTHGYAAASMPVEAAIRLGGEALAHAATLEMETDEHELRRVLRPEAEASLWWAIQSPAVPAGPYIKLDVGAGTTNVSLFRMVQAWSPDQGFLASKDRLCFFGAASVPLGMDLIDAALCARFGGGQVSPIDFRGREREYFETSAALNACERALSDIYKAVRKAAVIARPHLDTPTEKEAWVEAESRPGRPSSRKRREVRVVPLGGGCLVEEIRDKLARHPLSPDSLLPPLELEAPQDLRLQGKIVPKRVLPFAAVAYGLANLDPVAAQWPEDIEPINHRARLRAANVARGPVSALRCKETARESARYQR